MNQISTRERKRENSPSVQDFTSTPTSPKQGNDNNENQRTLTPWGIAVRVSYRGQFLLHPRLWLLLIVWDV